MMKKAGFAEIRVGFESVQGEFHRTLDRKLEASMLAEGLEILLQEGFTRGSLSAYLLAGLPGQEAGEVEQSIRHVADLGVRPLIAEYSPTPGSPLWPQAVRQSTFDLEAEPLTHNNSMLPMRWSGFSFQDLERLKRLSRSLWLQSCPQARL
jgi:hypothetical protein